MTWPDTVNDINVESLKSIGIKNAKKDTDTFSGMFKEDEIFDWWFSYRIDKKDFTLRKYKKGEFPIQKNSETIFRDEPCEFIDDLKQKLSQYNGR